MEYLSATKIQALYRSHLSRRRNQAVTIIISVLKSQANYNALTAAFWAARKITRFSAKVGRDYRLRRRRQAIIRYLTTSTWLSIKSTAIDNTIFRASLARNMVNRILSVGVRAIALCIVTARQQKEKVAHSKPNRSYSRGNSLKSPMAPKKTTKAAPRMKFHLTAFRRKISFCHSWYNPATEKDYSAQAMTEGLMSNKFHHYSHEDHLLHSVLEIEKKNQKSSLRTVNIDFVCPEEDERLKRLALLHKQKEEQMEIERQRRLQYIEEVCLPSFLPLHLSYSS